MSNSAIIATQLHKGHVGQITPKMTKIWESITQFSTLCPSFSNITLMTTQSLDVGRRDDDRAQKMLCVLYRYQVRAGEGKGVCP